ncbi:MAG TPA: hypothetical protein VMW43_07000 [Bacteroidota bacterium]|nr:hypothetical protein [Bacteroidota bacterium]
MRTAVVLLAALISCSALSCLNPFAPRINTELGQQICGDLSQVENIFCAFRNAYAFKDTTLYGSLLSPSFAFIYTDYDLLIEKTWGREDEMKLTNTMFQSVQSLTLIWNSEIAFTETDTSETIERGYDLTVTFGPTDVEEVNGVAEFYLTRTNAGDPWKLLRWNDKSNF